MKTKKNTPTEFQIAVQNALSPILEKYCPKGSKRSLIVTSFDGEEETTTGVLCGIIGNTEGLVQSLKSLVKEPAVKPLFEEAMNQLEFEESVREVLGAGKDCPCPDCAALREQQKRNVDPSVN